MICIKCQFLAQTFQGTSLFFRVIFPLVFCTVFFSNVSAFFASPVLLIFYASPQAFFLIVLEMVYVLQVTLGVFGEGCGK